MFAKTVRTRSTVVEDECATGASIGFLLCERVVEREEDDKGDADS